MRGKSGFLPPINSVTCLVHHMAVTYSLDCRPLIMTRVGFVLPRPQASAELADKTGANVILYTLIYCHFYPRPGHIRGGLVLLYSYSVRTSLTMSWDPFPRSEVNPSRALDPTQKAADQGATLLSATVPVSSMPWKKNAGQCAPICMTLSSLTNKSPELLV